MEVFGVKAPIARKEHKCDLCHGIIRKGEEYVRWVCSDGGHAEGIKVHSRCRKILGIYLGNDIEFTWDEVEDYVREVCIDNNLCTEDTPLSEMVVLVDAWNRRA